MYLIGLAGRARVGKDTVGRYLENKYRHKLYAFADPLKRACHEMFGVPLEYFYDDDLKEEVIPEWGFSPREMAQLLGTEGGRELFRQDIWINRAYLEYSYTPNAQTEAFVITDVRFDNEADFIRSKGGFVIHVRKKNAKQVGVSSHKSEHGVTIKLPDDFVVDNDGTFEELYSKIDGVMSDIKYRSRDKVWLTGS